MPKRRNLSVEERARVVALHDEGYSGRAIARKLKIRPYTVQEIIKKVEETGTVRDRPQSGRRTSTTPRQDRLLTHLSLLNRKATSRIIKRDFEDVTNVDISTRTVRRRLLKSGLRGCVAARKPLRTAVHKRKRLACAKERKGWTEEQWGRVLFSDESTFELIPGRRIFVRRRKGEKYHPECVVPTMKHGGVWGCMAANGVGRLRVVHGCLNAAAYIRLICNTLKQDGRKLCGPNFIFQQDGAPCHTARRTISWFERKGIPLLPWPSQSPDLNPIEHLWEVMKQLENKPFKNIEELKEAIFETWNNVSRDIMQKLATSMPCRCSAVIAAHGSHTKY